MDVAICAVPARSLETQNLLTGGRPLTHDEGRGDTCPAPFINSVASVRPSLLPARLAVGLGLKKCPTHACGSRPHTLCDAPRVPRVAGTLVPPRRLRPPKDSGRGRRLRQTSYQRSD